MQVDAWSYRQGLYVTTAKSILKHVDELAFEIRNIQLFHKPFVYFPLSGTHAKGNSRVLNMLSKLSLSDNVWKAPGDFERIYHLPIDWDKIEESLAPLRERSVTFLREALK